MSVLRPTWVVLALTLAACGGAEKPEAADRSLRIDAESSGALRFQRAKVETQAGTVAIRMTNPSAVPHAIAIRGKGAEATGETVGRDGTSEVVVALEPGTYQLVCPVAGHEQAGMVADLTVR